MKFRLEAEAVYLEDALAEVLGISPATLASVRRSGCIRHARVGRRILYRGVWVLDWLEKTAGVSGRFYGVE